MVTIELVINSVHLTGIRVTISCRYWIAFEVMLLFLVFTGRMPRSGKLPVLNLLTGQKSGFPPAGATHCTDSRQTWQGRRARGSAWLCKISPQLPQGVGMQLPKYQKSPLFGKESPRRGNSLDRFRKFLRAFIRLTILH